MQVRSVGQVPSQIPWRIRCQRSVDFCALALWRLLDRCRTTRSWAGCGSKIQSVLQNARLRRHLEMRGAWTCYPIQMRPRDRQALLASGSTTWATCPPWWSRRSSMAGVALSQSNSSARCRPLAGQVSAQSVWHLLLHWPKECTQACRSFSGFANFLSSMCGSGLESAAVRSRTLSATLKPICPYRARRPALARQKRRQRGRIGCSAVHLLVIGTLRLS